MAREQPTLAAVADALAAVAAVHAARDAFHAAAADAAAVDLDNARATAIPAADDTEGE